MLQYLFHSGEWKNNKANGKGKFFHVDGDVYEGKKKPILSIFLILI